MFKIMTPKKWIAALAAIVVLSGAGIAAAYTKPAVAAIEVGKPAPEFSVKDIKGQDVSLSGLKGKIVVMEWTNHQCPYVVKHYATKNMQGLQQDAAKDGVVWLSVVSSAPGKQGNVTAEEAQKIITEQGASPAHKILDPEGTLGRLYGAQTTPHMFVINAEGVLAYAGAIDDNDSFSQDTVKDAKNYVRAAWTALKAGNPVEVSSTKAYGCSVKYSN
jgi:peroxiredoxin